MPGRFLLGDGTTSRSGARADPLRERPFKFMQVPESSAYATIFLLSSSSSLPTANSAEGSNDHVGTIVLKIKRIRRVEDAPANVVDRLPDGVLASRRAGDLCVGYVSVTRDRYDRY